MMNQIAVVILNWNGRLLLERFLPSVVTYSNFDNVEIVVADNGSTDDSVEFLKKEFPDVKLLLLDKNYGFAGGYNKALQQVDSNFYILLNSDVEVTEQWISPLLTCMQQENNIAAVMPKIRDYYKRQNFEYAGAAGGFIDYMGIPYCRGRIFNSREEDKGQYDKEMNVHWTSGAAMMIRAEIFHRMGGFDDSYFAHMEEIDLCWRMGNIGYQMKCVPKAVVYHAGGATLAYQNAGKVFLNMRNSLSTIFKNHPRPLIPMLFRLFMDTGVFLAFVFSGRGRSAYTVLLANFVFYQRLIRKKIVRKNTKDFQENKFRLHPKCILIHYYLLGKKKFSYLSS